jgi:cytosine/adenosine deaminase-related metal-dependent hydrolase
MTTNLSKTSKFILRGGTRLQHDQDDHVHPIVGDILVEDGIIKALGNPDLPEAADKSVTVIDCQGKIVSPGFISTHHHVWQSPLKGRHADETLLEYMATGNATSVFFSAEDGFWGELGGALEAIDAGTTTVLDHSHLNISPEHRRYPSRN